MAGLEVLAVAGVARVRGSFGRLWVGGGLCRGDGVLAHGWFHSLVRPGGMCPGRPYSDKARTTLAAQTKAAPSHDTA
ncbi:hypothetical protein GCM10023257_20710 [Streptomyces hyderabadensis]|uniref:Uncharacterized protein n=1 Tax=Streptomyces hyderabadensis TaxID=598549 RepID=A0ABP9HYX9_9ACTN